MGKLFSLVHGAGAVPLGAIRTETPMGAKRGQFAGFLSLYALDFAGL
jgi:hypothetical protein